MQNPFKGSRERSLASEITALRVRRSDLEREYTEADASVTAAASGLEDLNVQGADRLAITKATSALVTAESDVKGKLGAIAKIETLIASKEAELVSLRDAASRKASIEALQLRERRFLAAHKALISALMEYSAAAGEIAPVIFEAKQLEIFASALAGIDLQPYGTLVPTLISNHIVAIQNGSAPATLPQAEAPAPKQIAPEPVATTRVYTLRPVRWLDPANPAMMRFHPQYADLDLPHALAEQAIAGSLAILITDRRVADFKRQHAPRHIHPEQCSWVGKGNEPDDAPKARHETIRHSAFAEQ